MSELWSLLLLLLKLLSYAAVVNCVGTILIHVLLPLNQTADHSGYRRLRVWLNHWLMTWSVTGIACALLQLPLQAGALAESGLAAMADPLMLDIVWQSAVGSQTLLRFSGFAAVLVTALWWSRLSVAGVFPRICAGAAVLLLAGSFTLTGHTVPLAGWVQTLLLLHVLAIAAWVGALWPLAQSCRLLAVNPLVALMQRFSRIAVFIVILLVACGLVILLQIVDSVTALLTTDYGRLMLVKLMLVSGMLLLAAWHKFKLVRELAQHQSSQTLRRSIMVETSLAALVLITTAIFTTLVGPAD